MWHPVLDRLAAERDVIAPDLPGHGESAPLPEAAVTPERYADVIEELLDELGVGRAHIAGNSLGGGIALVLRGLAAARSRHRALADRLLDTKGRTGFCRRSIVFAATAARALEPVAPLILGNPVGRTLTSAQLAGRPWRMTAEESIGATRNLGRSRACAPRWTAIAAGASCRTARCPAR